MGKNRHIRRGMWLGWKSACLAYKNSEIQLGPAQLAVVAHICKPSNLQAEAG